MSNAVVSVESVSLILDAVVHTKLSEAVKSLSRTVQVAQAEAFEFPHPQQVVSESSRIPTVSGNEISVELRDRISQSLSPRVREILAARNANVAQRSELEGASQGIVQAILEAEQKLTWYDGIGALLRIPPSCTRTETLQSALDNSRLNQEQLSTLKRNESELNQTLKDLFRDFRLSCDPCSSCLAVENEWALKLKDLSNQCAKTAEEASENITTFTSPDELRTTLKLISAAFSQCAQFLVTFSEKERQLRAESVALEPGLRFSVPSPLVATIAELNDMIDLGWRSATEIHKTTLPLFRKLEVYFKDIGTELLPAMIKRLEETERRRAHHIRKISLEERALVE